MGVLWHVKVNGEWVSVRYEGYAPVNVKVNDRLQTVEFRHMAVECDRAACAGIRSVN